MKRTISEREMVRDLMNDSNADWTEEGAEAIVQYLLKLEENTDSEIEWDVVAVRCDFSESSSAVAAAQECGLIEESDDVSTAKAMKLLQYHTTVIEVGRTGRVIVAAY